MKKTEFAILFVSIRPRPVIHIEGCIIEKASLIPLILPDTSSTASTKLANHFQVHGARKNISGNSVSSFYNCCYAIP